MKKKQVIRLTESDLHRVIKESVKKVLNESYNRDYLNNLNKTTNSYDGYDGKKGNSAEELYFDILYVKRILRYIISGLGQAQNRLNKNLVNELFNAAITLENKLTDEIIQTIINGLTDSGMSINHRGDVTSREIRSRNNLDLSVPFNKRHSSQENEEPFDQWYYDQYH